MSEIINSIVNLLMMESIFFDCLYDASPLSVEIWNGVSEKLEQNGKRILAANNASENCYIIR